MNADRKPGFYWVRRWEGASSRGPWEIAEWRRAWWFVGYSTPMSDAELESVGPIVTMPTGLPS